MPVRSGSGGDGRSPPPRRTLLRVQGSESGNQAGSAIAVRRLLIAGWLAVMTLANFSLPAYKGFADTSGRALWIGLYLLVAALALVTLRSTAPSRRTALVASGPSLVLLALAAVAIYAQNRSASQFRGEPLFLYVGSALLASWAVLVVSTAVVSWARWNRPGGMAVTLFVAALGLMLGTIRID